MFTKGGQEYATLHHTYTRACPTTTGFALTTLLLLLFTLKSKEKRVVESASLRLEISNAPNLCGFLVYVSVLSRLLPGNLGLRQTSSKFRYGAASVIYLFAT